MICALISSDQMGPQRGKKTTSYSRFHLIYTNQWTFGIKRRLTRYSNTITRILPSSYILRLSHLTTGQQPTRLQILPSTQTVRLYYWRLCAALLRRRCLFLPPLIRSTATARIFFRSSNRRSVGRSPNHIL